MTKKAALFFVAALFASVSLVNAQNDSGNGGGAAVAAVSLEKAASDQGNGGRVVLPEGLVLKPHVYAHFEAGEIEQGTLNYIEMQNNTDRYGIDHVWTEDADVELGLTALYHERLKMEASIGAKMFFSYPIVFSASLGDINTKYVANGLYLDQAYAQYHFGSADSPWLMAEVGYFRFKYNPDVRNLGEYMFRTGTYPIYFDMSFDSPFQRLLGLHVQDNFFNSLKLDFLLTSATVFPTMNWSFAALGDYDIAALHFIHVGAGVDFADLLDVYTNHSFLQYGGDPTSFQSPSYNFAYIAANGDTNYYTFKGTKVMGRISIDPKAFIKWKYFGEDDLKLYAEADLIGVESYPDSGIAGLMTPSYSEWQQKMPIAIGFNVPTFRTLDVLNAEMEWFGAKYYNDASYVFSQYSEPIPAYVSTFGSPGAPVKSQIKWSLYAKKSFFNGHFALTGQVARDHLVLPSVVHDVYEYWNELLVTSNDWWWVLKASWMF